MWWIFAAGVAFAHGGINNVDGVQFLDGRLVVVSAYGLVQQDDAGAWTWTCEEVTGSPIDAWVVAVGQWGEVWGSPDGIVHSDDGCTYSAVTDGPVGRYVTAFAAQAGTLYAVTGEGDQENAIWRSDDSGATFSEGAVPLPGHRLTGLRVVDGTFWVLGRQGDAATVAWSVDTVAWNAVPVGDVEVATLLGATAHRAWVAVDGLDGYGLIRVTSEDAQRVLSTGGAIDALDTGPGAGEVWVGGAALPMQRSTDDGATWSAVAGAPLVRCLENDGDARFACGDTWGDQTGVWRSPLGADGPWSSEMWLGDVRGVRDCPEGSTVATLCAPLWDTLDDASAFDLRGPSADVREDEAKAQCGCGGGDSAWLLPVGLWGWLWPRRKEKRHRHVV